MRKGVIIISLILLVLISSGCIGGDQTTEAENTTAPSTTSASVATTSSTTTTSQTTSGSSTTTAPLTTKTPTTTPIPTTTIPPTTTAPTTIVPPTTTEPTPAVWPPPAVVGQGPRLRPRKGIRITDYSYVGDTIIGGTTTINFENTGDSGEVQIISKLEDVEMTQTFLVEEKQFYRLFLGFGLPGRTDSRSMQTRDYAIYVSSPSFTVPVKLVVEASISGLELSGPMDLTLWDYKPPEHPCLTVFTYEEDKGSVSWSIGALTRNKWNHYTGCYEYGTEMTLTATPSEGYVFKDWAISDDVSDSWIVGVGEGSPFITITMLEDIRLYPRFF